MFYGHAGRLGGKILNKKSCTGLEDVQGKEEVEEGWMMMMRSYRELNDF